MATSVKSLCALFFFISVIHEGTSSQCTKDDLYVGTSMTGELDPKPEWAVTIKNQCTTAPCSFSNVVLTCSGFQTALPIDPSKMSKEGDDCIINNRNPIAPNATPITFSYYWDQAYDFQVKDFQIIGC